MFSNQFIIFALLFNICSPNGAVSMVYHIATDTTETEFCANPCLTLSQFATDVSYYHNDSNFITLVFQPGIHYLDTNMTLSDLDNFSIVSENSTAQILCVNHSHFLLNSSHYIRITNVEFVGCGGNQVENVKEFILQNVRFKGQAETETALELINTAAEIINCTFESNNKGKLRCVSNNPERSCVFKEFVGAAIIATHTKINISQSTFRNNRAAVGAILFAEQWSIINVNNSTFTKNRGVFYAAVMYSSKSIITIQGSKFDGNTGSGGPGVFFSLNSHITIETSKFANNIGGLASGAVLDSDNSSIKIGASIFYNNTGPWGGVIRSVNSNTTIVASILADNSAYFGGVLNSRDSIIAIETSNFNSNSGMYGRSWSGSGRGGVVHSVRSTIRIRASQFDNSSTNSEGGVFYSSGSSIIIETSEFNSNKAVYGNGGVVYSLWSTITISASEFDDSRTMFAGGGVLYSYGSTVTIAGSKFSKSNARTLGGVMDSYGSTITIQESEFSNNNATTGAVLSSIGDTVTTHASIFYDNSAHNGGVLNSVRSNVTTEACVFRNNNASNGGVLYSDSSTVKINSSEFESNLATSNGVLYSKSSTIEVKTSGFHSNNASLQGGVVYSERSNITLNTSNFTKNSAPTGAVVYATDSSVINYSSLLLANNSAENYALIYLTESEFNGYNSTSRNSTFLHNLGSVVAFNSIITLMGHDMFMHTKPPQTTVDKFQEGGAVTLFQSNAFFNGVCTFENNHAENGGAILSTESKIYVNGDVTIAHNTAARNGGGVYLSNSELNCQRRSTFVFYNNTAAHKGGGLHAISSPIKATSSVVSKRWPPGGKEYTGSKLSFHENKAVKGGGLSLEANAKLSVLKYDSIIVSEFLNRYDTNTTTFTSNSAHYGGAVYVDDDTNSGTCASDPKTECFFQVLAIHGIGDDIKLQAIQFSQNHASISGSTLYGGLLDRCAVSQFAEIRNKFTNNFKDGSYGITYLKNVSGSVYYNVTSYTYILNDDNTLKPGNHDYKEVLITTFSVSSRPVQVCLCINNVHDCTHQGYIQVKKGESFTLSLVAVDQVGTPVNATIQTSLSFTESGLSEGQLTRQIPAQCTDLTFNVVSPHNSEHLTLYATDGPCKDAELSRRTVEVQFLPCSCPVGLQISRANEINCTCECHGDISQYVSECDGHTGSFVKELQSRAWISYINSSNAYGYLTYPNCPFDYCSSLSQIRIDLNQPNGADVQCAFDRSSLLCGSCLPGHSLSLGSSHCLSCPSYWPALLIAITIAAILAGIALVSLLLVLNMTVAVGTINGLIFYANVVYANKSVLLPFQGTSFVTMFVSWMNLELGIDTCYFQGMDTYTKTWLQLAFPTYIICLVVLIIVISSHSMRFSNLIGKKNPVATLTTLILLSYAKFLAVCFKSLSVGILEYPDGSREWLWLPDANVKYLTGKHIPLYIITILILLGGLLYTALLFLWQWLLCLPSWRIFKWTRYPKIQTFVETHHMPYAPKHRYWTGLLLIVRIILYLVATVNVSNNPTISLTAVIFTVCFILGLKAFIGSRLYRKWSINVLETFFYLNILFFAVFTWYSLSNTDSNWKAAAYTSVIITFIVLLLIILYHVYTYTSVFSKVKKTKLGKRIDGLFVESNPKPKPKHHLSLPPDDDIHRFNELLDMIDRPVNTNDYTLPLGRKTIEPTHSEVVVHKPCLVPPDPEKSKSTN